jgi:hypothetical protein
MLAFLLHGIVAAAPAGHHVAFGASCASAGHLHIKAGDHEADSARTDIGCCGLACSITLLPVAAEIAMDGPPGSDQATLIHGKPGIDPEGIRRPPKPTA